LTDGTTTDNCGATARAGGLAVASDATGGGLVVIAYNRASGGGIESAAGQSLSGEALNHT